MKRKPKPGRGRKRHDAPVRPNALKGATTGERLIAAHQGRFEPIPTTFAELLAGLVELGNRLRIPKKGPLPNLANLHAIAIQQASDAELSTCIEAVGRDIAATLRQVDLEKIPALLRQVADVIESRPLQRHEKSGPIVLAPADPTTAAAALLLGEALREFIAGGRRDIDGPELLAHLRAMPAKASLADLRRHGAKGDDRTVRQKQTQLFPELRRAPGRPRKPDK